MTANRTGPAAAPSDLSWPLWIGLPILALGVQFVAKAIGEDFFDRTMRYERGFVEVGTVVILALATLLALRIVVRERPFPTRWVRLALLGLAFACFVFMGEEASWGQHFFGWSTPEAWAAFNPRGETSIHNASPWFDAIPRTIFTVLVIVFGIIVPLRWRAKGVERRGTIGWLMPTIIGVPTAVLALTISLPKKVYEDLLDTEVPLFLDISPGESKELLLGLFLFLYIASLGHRLAQRSEARPA